MLYIILIFVIVVIYKIAVSINNMLIFRPIKEELDTDYFKEMELKYNIKIKSGFIDSTNNCRIHYIYLKNPNNDKLFLFAHGNAGNILHNIESSIVQFLFKHGSVLMFDYRGYGCSIGDPSEKGLRDDILTVWNYVINELKYNPNNVIIYGLSLGCSFVSWLVYYLLNNNKYLPRGIILQSGFYSLKEITSDMFHPILSYFLVYEFDNNKYINYIKTRKKDYPIILLHSKEDKVINYNHSHKLSIENNCVLQEIFGPHGEPIIDDNVDKLIKNYLM